MAIKIYTDGACSGNPGPGGWGAVIIFDENKRPQFMSGYVPDTTNNRMELMSAIKALDLVASMGLNQHRIEVYSDSAYLVNAIKCDWIGKWIANNWLTAAGEPVKNQDLWQELNSSIKKFRSVLLFKVKGHNGNKYNEYADQLARREIELHAGAKIQG